MLHFQTTEPLHSLEHVNLSSCVNSSALRQLIETKETAQLVIAGRQAIKEAILKMSDAGKVETSTKSNNFIYLKVILLLLHTLTTYPTTKAKDPVI